EIANVAALLTRAPVRRALGREVISGRLAGLHVREVSVLVDVQPVLAGREPANLAGHANLVAFLLELHGARHLAAADGRHAREGLLGLSLRRVAGRLLPGCEAVLTAGNLRSRGARLLGSRGARFARLSGVGLLCSRGAGSLLLLISTAELPSYVGRGFARRVGHAF